MIDEALFATASDVPQINVPIVIEELPLDVVAAPDVPLVDDLALDVAPAPKTTKKPCSKKQASKTVKTRKPSPKMIPRKTTTKAPCVETTPKMIPEESSPVIREETSTVTLMKLPTANEELTVT